MSIFLIIYIVLALALLVWLANIPHTPTSLDPEKPSIWDFPPWYMLIMLLVIIGVIIHKVTE